MKAIIFANGEMETPNNWAALRDSAKLIIAADGGAKHALALGLHVDLVIGDLDSISEDELSAMQKMGVEILRYPAEKNQTDIELALLEAQKRGAKSVAILAGLGRRWDHSLANILLMAQAQFRDLNIEFIQGEQRIFPIQDEIEIIGVAGMRLSLLPIAGHVSGLSTQGLQYALEDEDLLFGSSRGVSNICLDEKVKITLGEGLLLGILSPGNLD